MKYETKFYYHITSFSPKMLSETYFSVLISSEMRKRVWPVGGA